MLIISEEEVLSLLTWDKTFKAVETAMKRYSENKTVQGARSKTQIVGKPNLLATMPGYLDDEEYGALGCKLLTLFPGNNKLPKPMPNILASIMLFDESTGIPKAVIGGIEITKWRTAAASAVATKYIYEKNGKPCDVLAILGAGQQGWAHAECFKHFFKFKEIRIWNRSESKAKILADDLNKKYHTKMFKFMESNESCVRGADVIVTVTNAHDPIVMANWVKPGAHINAVGLGRTHHSEVEENLYYDAEVYIDHWEGAKIELAGLEKIIKFKAEVGKVILDEVKLENNSRVTIFQSLGMAIEDCAMGRLIYDTYVEQTEKNM